VLLQRATGRYLQLQITLTGNGRTTPAVRALRAYYPRFAYPHRYLPEVYLEDSESNWFLERFLANPEGFFTDLEGKVRDIPLQFDPRTVTPDALEWLGTWLGIFMDPIWEQLGERRRSGGDQGYRPALDRRRLLLRYALRLYARRGTPDGIRLALHLLLDPFLEECLDRFRTAATERNESLAAELAALGIGYPGPAMTDAQLEELMLAYLLAPSRPSKIRIVERYLTRGGRAPVEGDAEAPTTTVLDEVGDFAHRFSVLIPDDLSVPEAAMVTRLVDLEKPAHTAFDVRRYWDFFVVGQARTGIDTVLGDDRRFAPMVVGQSYVAEGFLSADYPQEVADRVILDRDGPFSMPPL
jgi:phage tail-like protein